MRNFPKQRLSFAEKSKDNFKWAKNVIDSLLLEDSSFRASSYSQSGRTEYERMVSNYRLFNNQLDQKDYERECEPYGLEVGQFKDEIQPYNKTYNKIQVLLGDEQRRPDNQRAVLVNPEGIKSKLAFHDNLNRQYVLQQIQSAIEAVNPYFSPEIIDNSQPVMTPDESARYMRLKYSEAREIKANRILDYLSRSLRIPEYKNDAYKHALISGYELVYVGLSHDNPTLEVVNPLGFFCHKSPETKYVQDGLYAGFRTYMTSGDILDKFGEHLTAEEVSRIDESRHGGFGSAAANPDWPYYHGSPYVSEYEDGLYLEGSYSRSDKVDDWLVQHVEWRSQKKVGFLSFTNQYGDLETDIVSEDFVIPEHATKSVVEEDYGTKVTYYTWTLADGSSMSINWS